jgi:8-oxo-dGTP pyrophosphatase MutT (NUDIX family)
MLLEFDEIIKIKCSRVGIIPYVKRNNELYFLMGKDIRTGDLCDFGGRLNRGETNLQAAIREFMEESHEIVDPSDLETVSCGVYDKRHSICILFCKVKKENFFEEAQNLFHASSTTEEFEEMVDIMWLTKDEMSEHIYGYNSIFWNRVKFALSNSADFGDELLSKL